jgi:hypothetical protein
VSTLNLSFLDFFDNITNYSAGFNRNDTRPTPLMPGLFVNIKQAAPHTCLLGLIVNTAAGGVFFSKMID